MFYVRYRIWREEAGQALPEYALIIACIAGAIVALTVFSALWTAFLGHAASQIQCHDCPPPKP